jgi:chromosome segregation ATPase
MAHWTDDPKIHSLMTYLGKTGKTGKPTRSAYVAEQVSQIMIKVEPRVAELRGVQKDHDQLMVQLEKYQDLIENKKRHIEGIKIEFDQAKHDLLSQNPNADIDAFNKDLRQAINDLEEDFKVAVSSIDGVKQSIRVKRTTIRGLEDRMEMYHKQVLKLISQLEDAARAKAEQQKSA